MSSALTGDVMAANQTRGPAAQGAMFMPRAARAFHSPKEHTFVTDLCIPPHSLQWA